MKTLTIILSFLMSLLLLEIFTRIVIDDGMNYEIEMMKYANQLKIISKYKEIGIEHKKDMNKTKLMGTDIFLNSDGFRNDYEVIKNNKKILMLGDSMTFGWGAQNTFSNILEKKLDGYQVLNAGIGNTNTIMQINNFFINYKDKYKYDLIILNFFINDFENVKVKRPNIFQKYSFFYTYFSSLINKILTKLNLKNNWVSFYQDTFLDENIEKNTLNQILRLKVYCEKNNIKFFINNIPELHNLKNYKFDKETNILKNFSKKNNIIFYDSFNILKNYNEEELWVTKLDPHANNKAHFLISEGLYPIIIRILRE